MGLMPAQEALLLEFELAGHSSGGAGDAHDAAVVHIDLADDQVVDAGHHLQCTAGPVRLQGASIRAVRMCPKESRTLRRNRMLSCT